MSADNWAVCPKCKRVAWEALMEKTSRLAKAYGKIPAEEFMSQQSVLRHEKETFIDPESLREDYELGIDEDGVFKVSYAGGCETCGLHYLFQVTRKVELP